VAPAVGEGYVWETVAARWALPGPWLSRPLAAHIQDEVALRRLSWSAGNPVATDGPTTRAREQKVDLWAVGQIRAIPNRRSMCGLASLRHG